MKRWKVYRKLTIGHDNLWHLGLRCRGKMHSESQSVIPTNERILYCQKSDIWSWRVYGQRNHTEKYPEKTICMLFTETKQVQTSAVNIARRVRSEKRSKLTTDLNSIEFCPSKQSYSLHKNHHCLEQMKLSKTKNDKTQRQFFSRC